MTETTQRPVPRRRARPAADENEDPMDVGQARASEAPAAGRQTVDDPPAAGARTDFSPTALAQIQPPELARQNSQATVTLNVRVSLDVNAIVARAIAETGLSKRAIVERALRNTYP